jgi:hypothetical protein
MSSTLPPEILDLIVDYLHDAPIALKACGTVSKSWVSRVRRHLFADIDFYTKNSLIEPWMKAFPDPSNTPAHYTRTLWVYGFPPITDAGPWIRAFHRVVDLYVDTVGWNLSEVSLVPLHGLSPTLKSLDITYHSFPFSEILNLICSFPSLEDLALIRLPRKHGDTREVAIPLTSPRLTGTLRLEVVDSAPSDMPRLLALPGGLHFSRIDVMNFIQDIETTMSLVSGCSETLNSLIILYYPQSTLLSATMVCQLMNNSLLPRCACTRDVCST